MLSLFPTHESSLIYSVIFVSKSHLFLFHWISPETSPFYWRSHSVVMVPKDSLYKCSREGRDLSYLHNVFQTDCPCQMRFCWLPYWFYTCTVCRDVSLGQSTVRAAAVALIHSFLHHRRPFSHIAAWSSFWTIKHSLVWYWIHHYMLCLIVLL